MIESKTPNTTDPSSAVIAEMWDALPGRPALSDYAIREAARNRRAALEALASANVPPDMQIRLAARAQRLAKRRAA